MDVERIADCLRPRFGFQFVLFSGAICIVPATVSQAIASEREVIEPQLEALHYFAHWEYEDCPPFQPVIYNMAVFQFTIGIEIRAF